MRQECVCHRVRVLCCLARANLFCLSISAICDCSRTFRSTQSGIADLSICAVCTYKNPLSKGTQSLSLCTDSILVTKHAFSLDLLTNNLFCHNLPRCNLAVVINLVLPMNRIHVQHPTPLLFVSISSTVLGNLASLAICAAVGIPWFFSSVGHGCETCSSTYRPARDRNNGLFRASKRLQTW